jgi:hypothetical protein
MKIPVRLYYLSEENMAYSVLIGYTRNEKDDLPYAKLLPIDAPKYFSEHLRTQSPNMQYIGRFLPTWEAFRMNDLSINRKIIREKKLRKAIEIRVESWQLLNA